MLFSMKDLKRETVCVQSYITMSVGYWTGSFSLGFYSWNDSQNGEPVEFSPEFPSFPFSFTLPVGTVDAPCLQLPLHNLPLTSYCPSVPSKLIFPTALLQGQLSEANSFEKPITQKCKLRQQFFAFFGIEDGAGWFPYRKLTTIFVTVLLTVTKKSGISLKIPSKAILHCLKNFNNFLFYKPTVGSSFFSTWLSQSLW